MYFSSIWSMVRLDSAVNCTRGFNCCKTRHVQTDFNSPISVVDRVNDKFSSTSVELTRVLSNTVILATPARQRFLHTSTDKLLTLINNKRVWRSLRETVHRQSKDLVQQFTSIEHPLPIDESVDHRESLLHQLTSMMSDWNSSLFSSFLTNRCLK